MRKFWKKTEGFTLVELIVVIAILGILAGVGTVGYSGYVKKANMAADEQLLRNINQAFAAACIENGEDIRDRTSATLDIDLTTKKVDIDSLTPATHKEAFAKYFAGNEDMAFRLTSNIVFDAVKHLFVDPADSDYVAVEYGGGTIYLSPEDAALFAGSTFNNPEKGLGIDTLLVKVNDVANTAAALTGGGIQTLNTILSSPEFKASAAAALGLDPKDANFEAELFETLVDLTAEKINYEGDTSVFDMTDFSTIPGDFLMAMNQIQANAAVLFTAQETAKMDREDVSKFFEDGGLKAQILGNVASDPGKALSQSALALGMFTSYAYYTEDPALQALVTSQDPNVLMPYLESEEFMTYLVSDQGEADLDAYLASLRMIESSTGDKSAVTTLVQNGFNDPALAALLQGVINNQAQN